MTNKDRPSILKNKYIVKQQGITIICDTLNEVIKAINLRYPLTLSMLSYVKVDGQEKVYARAEFITWQEIKNHFGWK